MENFKAGLKEMLYRLRQLAYVQLPCPKEITEQRIIKNLKVESLKQMIQE